MDSHPHAKIHPKRNQGLDDARIWRRPRGGRGRDIEAWRTCDRQTAQGSTGTWVQTEDGKGGSTSPRETVADADKRLGAQG